MLNCLSYTEKVIEFDASSIVNQITWYAMFILSGSLIEYQMILKNLRKNDIKIALNLIQPIC